APRTFATSIRTAWLAATWSSCGILPLLRAFGHGLEVAAEVLLEDRGGSILGPTGKPPEVEINLQSGRNPRSRFTWPFGPREDGSVVGPPKKKIGPRFDSSAPKIVCQLVEYYGLKAAIFHINGCNCVSHLGGKSPRGRVASKRIEEVIFSAPFHDALFDTGRVAAKVNRDLLGRPAVVLRPCVKEPNRVSQKKPLVVLDCVA